MTEDQFWELIETSRKQSADCESQARQLQGLLFKMSAQDIVEFDQILHQKLIESYRWDFWGIACLINGSCSETGLQNFCGWLISQGRSVYHQVLADPESILNYVEEDEEEVGCRAILYASQYSYDDVVGDDLPPFDLPFPPSPAGEPLMEGDLEKRFPKIAEVFVH